MLSRRKFLGVASAAVASATAARSLGLHAAPLNAEDLCQYADPRVGTGGLGHCFPAATVPFGAVQLGPDTLNSTWDRCAGYHWNDTSIMGFSHTHLSGTGIGDLLDFLVMAGTGQAKLVPGTLKNPEQGYRSRFRHEDEDASPGYYSVLLQDYKVRAELTATERAGFHRYTFPQSDESYLIVDLAHSYQHHGESTVSQASLQQVNDSTLMGGHVTNAWAKGRHAFLYLQLSKKPTKVAFYNGEQESSAAEGKALKCVLHFKTAAHEQILVKVGLSACSAEGARRNLEQEIPHWDFDRTRTEARARWQTQLAKIRVKGADDEARRTFYSSMYHLCLGPTLFDDVDGRYRGMDNEVHTLPVGQHNYTTYSLWDTYRAAHPAFTLIEPQRTPDFVSTLIRMAEESPEGMPVWPLQGYETDCMTGYHSAAVIAEACNKGIARVDYERAYPLMRKRAMVDDYRGLDLYRKYGYIPADREKESVSKTIEYCYDDWAIAHVAKALGKSDDAALLSKRSLNYRNYFDPKTRFMRARLENGAWAEPFDPKSTGHSDKWRDYTESDAWQASFAIQHDPQGLIDAFGGREAFTTKLDRFFVESSEVHGDVPPDITGMIGQYAHGNEPSHHIAYLYVYAGQPHKTQALVKKLLATMYASRPDGLQGNDDVGQMSAWYILSALGFYPVDPVSGNYILGAPLFDRATVDLGGGKFLCVEAKRVTSSDAYVQGVSLNGKPQRRAWFHHREIAQGGTLVFTMGAEPSATFATAPEDAPPSFVLEKA
ncbi:GH92 family glycosyl hydrolase [Granulicella cerasi]|uniref:GH92 family glycosyl hydrolase n=1 Tax=Granulicella cerasi TaxID=741063 RepID=A0ABW1ZCD2_9BACT|nr:GH92 family glycosyl hydrolase [Granulicella cerasi]